MRTLFFTGFPGFLSRTLLPRLLARGEDSRAICLVQAKFADVARAAVEEIEAEAPACRGRITLVAGDLTRPSLGLEHPAELARSVTEIHHAAALYDLSAGREPAFAVNVEGTRGMLDFAARCASLERFHYVSTCYVSGRYAGIFDEEDLEKGQVFNNFYEETKHRAEVLVRERMARAGLRATIYRPSIVVGDSRTGVTQKLDGPYYLLRWLLRQRHVALLPVIGDVSRFRFNVVPCDFVVDGIVHLSGLPTSVGKTYQLADHAPPTCEEALELMAQASGRRIVRVPMPAPLARAAIDRVPGVGRVLQIPSSLVDYMSHPTHYLNRATLADLAPANLAAPRFADYVPRLAEFTARHLSMSSAAMA